MTTKMTADRRERAEAHFKAREILKADAEKARDEYYAAQQAVLDRTRELREQRLAREMVAPSHAHHR